MLKNIPAEAREFVSYTNMPVFCVVMHSIEAISKWAPE